MIPKSTVAYASDSNNSMSWLDDCAASSTIPQAITCIAVLNGFVTSDYYQSLAVLINASRSKCGK